MIHNALVVDDSRTARFMLGKILQRLGVATATANSAEEALTYLQDHVPDAIFIDHVMPGIDGLRATRQIKRDPRFADVPIVIFTAKEGDEYIAQARSFGAYSVLTKPPTDEFVRSLLDELALDAAMSGDSGVDADDDAPALVDQPAPGTAAPGLSEDAVARIARQAVDEALGERLEAALDALVEQRVEALRGTLQSHDDGDGERLDELAAQAREAFDRDGASAADVARLDARLEEVTGRLEALRGALQSQDEGDGERLDELAAQAREAFARDGASAADVARLDARLEEVAGRLEAMQQQLDGSGQAAADGREQVATLADELARLGARVDGLADLEPRLAALDPVADRVAGLDARIAGLEPLAARVDDLDRHRADLAERTVKLVEAYVERSSKRYANAVTTYVRKDAATVAGKLVEKHVARLRDDLVEAQAEAGRRSVPLLPTLLAGVALVAAAAALLLLR
jgi:CheY-like chemotaxis protein